MRCPRVLVVRDLVAADVRLQHVAEPAHGVKRHLCAARHQQRRGEPRVKTLRDLEMARRRRNPRVRVRVRQRQSPEQRPDDVVLFEGCVHAVKPTVLYER